MLGTTMFVLAGIAAADVDRRPATASADLAKTVQVRVVTRIELPKDSVTGQKVRLWVPVPFDSPHQDLHAIDAPGTPQLTRDPQLGNRFLYYEFQPVSAMPGELNFQFDLVRRAHQVTPESREAKRPDRSMLDLWSRPNQLIPVDGQAKTMSDAIVQGAKSDWEKAERIYQYVFEHMAYDKGEPGWGNADFNRACKLGKGNCTDFHGMFLALCRAQGIPAQFEIGLEFATDGSVSVPGSYHCWASCYLEGHGWVPVDVSTAWKRSQAAAAQRRSELARTEKRAGFGLVDAFRVTFSRGLDVPTAPSASATVRFLIDPVLEVDGRRVAPGDPSQGGCRRTWSYSFVE